MVKPLAASQLNSRIETQGNGTEMSYQRNEQCIVDYKDPCCRFRTWSFIAY